MLTANSGLIAGQSSEKTILVVGDSLSAAYGINRSDGWVPLLSAKIAQKKFTYQVINSSISGDTTINGLNRLKPLLDKYNPHITIIALGANDGLRGLSLATMKQNLLQMIELSQAIQSDILLVGIKLPPSYGKRYTEAFHDVYLKIANDKKLKIVPFILEGVGGVAELMQRDGLHPTKEAQPIIMNTVWQKLEPML